MRAIAVAAVFAYHLYPSRVHGGFTGVDVFFVISGFLITGNLVREATATGRIDVWRFWSRRMRRLLPASLLVLAVTAAATLAIVPANRWTQFLGEITASTLYVQNWYLAGASVDYLAAANAPSPVQHFWTLSVEEQFYVATPLLLIALLVLGRRLADRRPVLFAGLLATLVASLACSIVLTASDAAPAYFATTTRAWEFCVGALLVFAPAPRSRRLAVAALVAGLALVVSAALLIRGSMPFPGILAAWPVAGAAAMIWGGEQAGGWWARIAAWRPVRHVGDVSYSVYLWHWPLVVLVPYATGHAMGLPAKAAVVLATLVLATLSTRFVEDPVRFSPRLLGGTRRPRTIAAWSAVGMALVVGVAQLGTAVVEARQAEANSRTAEITRLLEQSPHPVASPAAPPSSAPGAASAPPTASPDPVAIPSAAPDLAACLGAAGVMLGAACDGVVPADLLVPDPLVAADDKFTKVDCFSGREAELNVCEYGPADAEVRLLVVGDSHVAQHRVAYEWIASRYGWHIEITGHGSCPWSAGTRILWDTHVTETCTAWKKNFNAWLSQVRPFDAIVVSMSRMRYKLVTRAGQSYEDAEVAGLAQAWKTQVERGSRVIVVRDNPRMDDNVTSCVLAHGVEANAHCSLPAAKALGERDVQVEAAAAVGNGAQVIDLTDIYCPDNRCLVVIGNVVVYQDSNHVTSTWARTLAPVLGERIAAQLP